MSIHLNAFDTAETLDARACSFRQALVRSANATQSQSETQRSRLES